MSYKPRWIVIEGDGKFTMNLEGIQSDNGQPFDVLQCSVARVVIYAPIPTPQSSDTMLRVGAFNSKRCMATGRYMFNSRIVGAGTGAGANGGAGVMEASSSSSSNDIPMTMTLHPSPQPIHRNIVCLDLDPSEVRIIELRNNAALQSAFIPPHLTRIHVTHTAGLCLEQRDGSVPLPLLSVTTQGSGLVRIDGRIAKAIVDASHVSNVHLSRITTAIDAVIEDKAIVMITTDDAVLKNATVETAGRFMIRH
jgi:hypothetical protein